MPRLPEYDRVDVLARAMDVFWAQGYEATSLQDLLAAMELSKSSFYQAFGSKEELFRSCLLHYQDALAAAWTRGYEEAPTALAFVEDYLLAIADNRNKDAFKGCMLMNAASEFAQSNPEVARVIRQGIGLLSRLLTEAVQRAQTEGEIAKSADPAALGTSLLATVSGMKTLAKAGTPKSRLRAVARAALVTLRQS